MDLQDQQEIHNEQVEDELYRAYLDCLFLDREQIQDILAQTQTYESAYQAAINLLEHMKLDPNLASLNLPDTQTLTPKQLPLYLDSLHRALWRLYKRGKQVDFLQSIQQELSYLLPKLWQAPQEQNQQLKKLKSHLLENAERFGNRSLAATLNLPTETGFSTILKAVDQSLAKAWPKQLGLIISQDQALIQQILANSNVSGIDWQVFSNVSEALQGKFYQDPSMLIITLDQPRFSLDRLLDTFSYSEAIAVVHDMASVQEKMLPGRISHILEEKWLSRFLSGLIQRNLLQRWRDARFRKLDFLTGLSSLIGISEKYQQLQELVARLKGPMCVAILDLPLLSEIEKQEGPYLTGEWLKSFGRFLGGSLRGSDWVGHWSPDKFILLLPQTNIQGAVIALERTLDKMKREHPLPLDGDDPQRVLFRAGITMADSQMSFEQVLFEGYQQLKQARSQPANQILAYDANALETALRPHILLLDDDTIIQEMLRFIFSREGYEITQLMDGSQVLETLEKKPVSLVVLDLKMPGMDGFEVLEKIRSQRQYDNLPVVILSSMKGESDLERGFELGADDFIHKPFSPTELVIRAKRFLR